MGYTLPSARKFLSMRTPRAGTTRIRAQNESYSQGIRDSSNKRDVSLKLMRMTAICLVTVALGVTAQAARADIIRYRDAKGRIVYVNTEDSALRMAARTGGAVAALRLMGRRKETMPGIEEHIKQTAKQNKVDPRLVRAMIEVESAWNPRARSRAGALGLMQLMPGTARQFGVRNSFDPKQNVTGGVRYLRFLLDRFDGDLTLSLAAYNAGETAVKKHNGVPPYRETRGYLERLRRLYGKLSANSKLRIGSIYLVVDEKGRSIYRNE